MKKLKKLQNAQIKRLKTLGVIPPGTDRKSGRVQKLKELGIITSKYTEHRMGNQGDSNYSTKLLQPWAIWQDWALNAWDADILKRVLRTKSSDSKVLDYYKIIHICDEMISQRHRIHNYTVPEPHYDKIISPLAIRQEWGLGLLDALIVGEIGDGYGIGRYKSIKDLCFKIINLLEGAPNDQKD